MKKIFIALICILFFATPVYAENPYSLYGRGNCVYLAYEMLERTWPAVPNIPRDYDAKDWVNLLGEIFESPDCYYQIVKADEPKPGNVVVFPATKNNKYGHVAYIYNVFEKDEEIFIDVLESAMWATKGEYPWKLSNCLCRSSYYELEKTKRDRAIFLDYKVKARKCPYWLRENNAV